MEKFRITVASLPDRERLVSEIIFDGVQWAEISQETDELIVQFYTHPRQPYWEFSLDDAINALEQAKKKLLGKKRVFTDSIVDPTQINEQGQEVLENILNHPEKKAVQYIHKLYGSVIDIEAPQIGGARFNEEGTEMLGFLEPAQFITVKYDIDANKKNFCFRIASDTSKEKVFAEIFYEDDQWAEISQEKEDPMIIFFSPFNTKYWEFSFSEAMKALDQAKNELLEL